MRILLCLFLFCTSSKLVSAHSYFFAFAEVEYNLMQEKLEGTVIFTAHDLEGILLKKNIISSKFDKLAHDSTTISAIGKELFASFKFINGNQEVKLLALDFQLTKNGLIEIYFTSEKVKLMDFIELEFSTLMDVYPKQQNKITFIQKNDKQTYVFMNNETRRKITII